MTSSSIKSFTSKSPVIPVAVTLLCLVPFAGKAFHMDDPLFIWSAKQIQKNPFDFYGFKVNWYGTEMAMSDVTKNPPAAGYYIALVGSLFGYNEIAMHLAFLLPAAAAAAGTYYLARQLCSQAVLGALASVLTPVFLVCSTNIMCDVIMLAFWVWAIFFWVRGIKEDKRLSLFLGAVLISTCTLTKYTGIALAGLLFVYSLMQKRRAGSWVLFFAIPALILSGYQWATHTLYGRGLLLDAAFFSDEYRLAMDTQLFLKWLTGLAFAGGCAATVLFYSPLLWSRRVLIGSAIIIILFIIALAFVEQAGMLSLHDANGIRWNFTVQLFLMLMGGISLVGLAVADFWNCKDADSLLLALWVVGIFIFGSFLNWIVSARSILPLVPAAGILLMRRLERRGYIKGQVWSKRLIWPLVPAAVLALLVCQADYIWANTARNATETIDKKFENTAGKIWFQGHWGFQYYMESKGHPVFDLKHSNLTEEDIIIFADNNYYMPFSEEQEKMTHLHGAFEFDRHRWLATMDRSLGAGFYADQWGALPFAAGRVETEEYQVYTVNQQKAE